MPADPFRIQIRKALQNPALQIALDSNTERRKAAYIQAFSTLPDPAENRRQARQIREAVLADLDHYLEQFIRNAQRNGFQIHLAENSNEAIALFLAIARQRNAHLVVKSKTMVSEEIELNHALEAAGIRVVETDLGEFIVQLRGERPGHILTPAVHLRRAEVGQTFHEKLGVPYTEDVELLTQYARLALRKVFLEADLGVSGVNLGVAETGMLCVLTNEGNGRMVTTLPKVHVALMGIERIVPTMADLATVISVLPRASSGQNITVYTNLIRGPARPDDPDGPQERHIILLDNGRRALREGALRESLYCIRCGACLNACPVFREIGGHAYVGDQGQVAVYSGPIGSVISPGMFGSQAFGNLAQASTLCGACREACPVGIDLPRMLLEVRAGKAQLTSYPKPAGVSPGLSLGLKVFSWIASSAGRFHFAQRMAALASGLFSSSSGWMRLPPFTGWGAAKDFPQPARQTFRQRMRYHQPLQSSSLEKQAKVVPDQPAVEESSSPRLLPWVDEVEMLEHFAKELAALGAEVIRCELDGLAEKIAALVRETGQEQVWAWDEGYFPEGLLTGLQSQGLAICKERDPEIKVGLTGALAAVAETGSVVLAGGVGRPLLASLLPEIHIVILRTGQLVQTLEAALQMEALKESQASVLVSGPSRTGDIELTLTVGVHGPKRFVIFWLP